MNASTSISGDKGKIRVGKKLFPLTSWCLRFETERLKVVFPYGDKPTKRELKKYGLFLDENGRFCFWMRGQTTVTGHLIVSNAPYIAPGSAVQGYFNFQGKTVIANLYISEVESYTMSEHVNFAVCGNLRKVPVRSKRKKK